MQGLRLALGMSENFKVIYQTMGLPWWLSGKESTSSVGDTGDKGLIPGSGRSPREGSGSPLQCSCLENPIDREAWQATQSMDSQRLGYD